VLNQNSSSDYSFLDLEVTEVMGGHDLPREILANQQIEGVGCHFRHFRCAESEFELILFVWLTYRSWRSWEVMTSMVKY